MPKSFFTIDKVTSLHSIRQGAAIHIIGVSGVAMAQIAVELARKGYQVTGSDKEFYEPMGSLLRNSAVGLKHGYDAGNIPANIDLVVIGNAISYDNPEVGIVEQHNLPYTCFPKILEESLISGKHSIVVTGTHGKSTTTAMIASTLFKLGVDPSYFIGGVAQDLPKSLHWGTGKYSVVEGDEYDSAFFAKVPKFEFYHPDTCVVNAIEYDHADIYPDLESINREFTKLITGMPASGTALCCVDFDNLKNLVKEWKRSSRCRIITFGLDSSADVILSSRKQDGFTQRVEVSSKQFGPFTFSIPLPGAFNAKNALATILTGLINGLDMNRLQDAVASFRPVKRRQEVRFNAGGVVLVEDFAHHPTAVNETIAGIREAFPDKKLWAVFEPRSNTSRRKVFQEDYVRAFKAADVAILCEVTARAIDANIELINVAELSDRIGAVGVESICLPNPQAIEEHITKRLSGNDVILLMSNGSFGGLPQSLENKLRANAP